jgi:hypothetical protein
MDIAGSQLGGPDRESYLLKLDEIQELQLKPTKQGPGYLEIGVTATVGKGYAWLSFEV